MLYVSGFKQKIKTISLFDGYQSGDIACFKVEDVSLEEEMKLKLKKEESEISGLLLQRKKIIPYNHQ